LYPENTTFYFHQHPPPPTLSQHIHHFSFSMPVKRSRQAKEAARAANHPYKLRSFRNSAQENIARDRPAEKLKQQKDLREQALQVLDRNELRKFPVEQLRRLAAVRFCEPSLSAQVN
jgi:hypothetical protein